jgi:hypothetical protein
MGRDVWIWMGGNPQRGPFEGVGHEIETFRALKWQRAHGVPFGPKKVECACVFVWAVWWIGGGGGGGGVGVVMISI